MFLIWKKEGFFWENLSWLMAMDLLMREKSSTLIAETELKRPTIRQTNRPTIRGERLTDRQTDRERDIGYLAKLDAFPVFES